jgi:hypothetical protein
VTLVACEAHQTIVAVRTPLPIDTRDTASKQPTGSGALVVASFTVVEYRASCVWECPYLVYAPLIELRETSGKNVAEVVAVEVSIGNKTTGVCRGSASYSPGLSAHLNGFYEYLWSNDIFLVSLDGQPFASDSATARITVRGADRVESQIEAKGAVQRRVANPVLPAPQWGGWDCSN